MPPKPFNLTLSAQSPLIRYRPSRDGPSASTWNITYEDTPWTNSTEVIGRGDSKHTSSFAGVTASLGWVGTDIFLYGSLQQGAEITADVDGSADNLVLNSGNGLLLVGKDMAYGWHEVRIKVDRGEVSLTGVTLTVDIGSSGYVNVSMIHDRLTLQEHHSKHNCFVSTWLELDQHTRL